MSYTLQECIERTGRLRRGKHVYKMLKKNGIETWDDLISKTIPREMLTSYEIGVVNDIRNKEIRIREDHMKTAGELYTSLREFIHADTFAKKMFVCLTANGHIYSIKQLLLISDDVLSAIPGIGKKSLDILKRYKAQMKEKKESAVSWNAGDYSVEHTAQPMLWY